MKIQKALTFDDVLIKPSYSEIQPSEVETDSSISKKIKLNIPILSAAMDTVTESSLAISIAQSGGAGVIHRNMSIKEQSNQVRQVKKFESGMVVNPITVHPELELRIAMEIMKQNNISGIPVTNNDKERKLVGILTNRDVRFVENLDEPVKNFMTSENLITANESIEIEEAKKILHKNRIEKLIVVDSNFSCIGLITVKDIERSSLFPSSTKDNQGSLRVGAAIGAQEEDFSRAEILSDSGVDFLVIDTAHGHSKKVIDMIYKVRKKIPKVAIVAGNVATTEGAKALADSGADAIKIGIGPGSICTTRIIAGIGVPQFTAISDCVETAKKYGIKVISDGGIKYSGDIAKALAAGADCVMIGSLFAGTDESPGDVFFYHGRSYKTYRGMGSLGAMSSGSADRYSQDSKIGINKLVPEGVEARVPYRGPLRPILDQLTGGLKASMGYTGSRNLKEFRNNAKFIEVTDSGMRESHVHDVEIAKESPNYPTQK